MVIDEDSIRRYYRKERKSYLDTAQSQAIALISEWKQTGNIQPLVDELNSNVISRALSGAIALGNTGSVNARPPLKRIFESGSLVDERFFIAYQLAQGFLRETDPVQQAISEAISDILPKGATEAGNRIMAEELANLLRDEVRKALKKLEKNNQRLF